MKRSHSIQLVLIGSTGLLALAACDQPDVLSQSDFFKDEKQCEAKYNPDACRQALADARQQHFKTAPYFANREECEAQFGVDNCMRSTELMGPPTDGATPGSTATTQSTPPTQATSSSGAWFMPLMMGYMMGRTMGGMGGADPVSPQRRDDQTSGGGTGGGSGAAVRTASYTGQPVYRDIENRAYSGNKTIGRFDSASIPPPRAPATSIARGGFGRSAVGASSSS